jgi:hypothetical protein
MIDGTILSFVNEFLFETEVVFACFVRFARYLFHAKECKGFTQRD